MRDGADDRVDAWHERLLGRTWPSVAEVSAACKGLSIPLALKAAWLDHGHGSFPGDGPDTVVRILSPAEVRDLHAAQPGLFVAATPFLLMDARRPDAYASVEASGLVRAPDWKPLGHIDGFLDDLLRTPNHLRR